jgi:D-alanyl-D-alanine carboxypeptidase/D-alanyl-D-alanine-endopeptidase (penicillin-binding protein 4)
MRKAAFAAAILALAPAAAPPANPTTAQTTQTLQQRVEARLRASGPGTRFGLVVAGEDGRELIAIAPDSRFMPASVTKMFVTAAAFANLPGLDRPDREGGASVSLDRVAGSDPDVILAGHGDARLSSAPDCRLDCLAVLADAVAARTKRVRDVIGDSTFFPDQRWSPGMSWNNIPTRSGTAISALSLDDNELPLRVRPGKPGEKPIVEFPAYYAVENEALTVAGGATDLGYDRLPGSFTVRLTGTIAAGAEPELLRLGIDDPAHYAAWRLRALLEARGVRVSGRALARYRSLPAARPAAAPAAAEPRPRPAPPVVAPDASLARLVPPPLGEDLVLTTKVSQNLHAELLLRRLGRVNGSGAIADGSAMVAAMLERAGLARAAWDFSDGSGMSTYNRIAPRGAVTFLRWAAAQPWGAAWRAGLPVGGVDGTLAKRFRGTPLEGRLFAKTGSLNATASLSGYLVARSGRTLTFSIHANDIPEGAAATETMDAALVMIAAEN